MTENYLLLSTDCYSLKEKEVLQMWVNGRGRKSR